MRDRSHTENGKQKTENKKPIALFYWSERKFILKDKENYGDLLSKYLVEKISGRPVKFVHPKKQPWYKWNKKNYLAAGSIIHHADKNSVVWGSGIIDNKQQVVKADFRAVRGPKTREYLLGKNYSCPKVYGDPALLMPKFYKPHIDKKYNIGIIPHYLDFDLVHSWYKNDETVIVIDLMTLDVEEVTRKILSCKQTISSSLHGIIISHAYRIPSIWVKFSDKVFGSGIKYQDYLESVELPLYEAEIIRNKLDVTGLQNLINQPFHLPSGDLIKSLQEGLLESCPFATKL